jgi:hypothetical protein
MRPRGGRASNEGRIAFQGRIAFPLTRAWRRIWRMCRVGDRRYVPGMPPGEVQHHRLRRVRADGRRHPTLSAARLREIEVPAHILCSCYDHVVVDAHRTVADRIPDGEFIIFGHSCHLTMVYEDGDAYLDVSGVPFYRRAQTGSSNAWASM